MKVRTEQQIFDDLATLCSTPGYPHALAFLCFRDSFVKYGGELSGQDYAKLFSFDRLIRTEISTLLGLMVRGPIDLTLPSPQELASLIARSDALLKELHEAMMAPFAESFKAALGEPHASPFTSAEAMREPIFYAAESAYSFQYRDLARRKYAHDSQWLLAHKGFSIEQARLVAKAIMSFLNQHLMASLEKLRGLPRDQWTVLDGFIFRVADILAASSLPADVVEKVLQAFAHPNDGNPTFTALHEFNATNAYPLLRVDEHRYMLFQYMSFVEALYDTPFFWMLADKPYKETAAANRGAFTEEFAVERLARVFGAANVYRNVDIWQSKGKKLGEVDVLVLFAGRAIVVQAKSKRLTLAARKGNDLQLQTDFKGAVQDACDQAVECSQLLLDDSLRFADAAGNTIDIPKSIKTVHPVCLLSDHYPALSFQALQFLKSNRPPEIKAPLVCDVFFLDTVTEMLETPLRYLSYLELRALAGDNILLSHEHTALGFHLKQNLWMGDADFIHLHDDVAVDLDVAMAVRRDGVEGKRTPAGILTLLEGTSVGTIISDIERSAHPTSVEVGLLLLKLSSDTARDLSSLIDRVARLSALDGKKHDATIGMAKASSGITVHCTAEDQIAAALALKEYCELRKYKEQARSWCGMVVEPGTGRFRFGFVFDFPWKVNEELDRKSGCLSPGLAPAALASFVKSGIAPMKRKVGRNAPCPCGSGTKYKKCHGRT